LVNVSVIGYSTKVNNLLTKVNIVGKLEELDDKHGGASKERDCAREDKRPVSPSQGNATLYFVQSLFFVIYIEFSVHVLH